VGIPKGWSWRGRERSSVGRQLKGERGGFDYFCLLVFLVGGDSFVAPMFLIECRGSFLMPDARDLGSFNPV